MVVVNSIVLSMMHTGGVADSCPRILHIDFCVRRSQRRGAPRTGWLSPPWPANDDRRIVAEFGYTGHCNDHCFRLQLKIIHRRPTTMSISSRQLDSWVPTDSPWRYSRALAHKYHRRGCVSRMSVAFSQLIASQSGRRGPGRTSTLRASGARACIPSTGPRHSMRSAGTCS